ncbi:MAG: YceI family protein [Cyclobacteriaceae bacterium]
MKTLQITLLVITALLCSIAGLKAEQKDLPKTSSIIGFKIKNAGINVDGKFEQFTTDIQYNAQHPEQSKFQGIIQVASINTGISMRDGHLLKPEYFDAEKFPGIKFQSLSVKSTSSNKLTISGQLTIRDITKPVVLDVDIAEVSGKRVYSTTLMINRREFGVGGKSWMMSDDVSIDMQIIE